jgi:hypothetical protein
MGDLTEDIRRRTTHPGVVRTRPATLPPVRSTQRCYLAEVNVRVAEGDLSWISRSLDGARMRLRPRPAVLSAAYIPDDGLLSCLVVARCAEDVHRLFGAALLPSVRVVDALAVPLQTPRRERR